ncbi:hypothetical protein DH2020_031623 [Rehmannia glutinosa]|uniref:DUF4378 domain-containing protein n=1 Tax=Rehmannia glutinosa TaxID=99300 RepID=A0ABR0VHP7_REHGL
MKDCEKRWKPNSTDSVIAMLMGFDKLHPQQPFHEKRKVLSESYVRNAASVGLRPGSLVSIGRSRSTNNEIEHEVKGVSEISEGKNDNILHKCVNSSTSKVKSVIRIPKVSKSLFGSNYKDRRSKNGEHCPSRNVLRYPQKHKHDSLAGHLGVDYTSKSLKFQLEIIDKARLFSTSISAIKPKSGLEDVNLDRHSRLGFREHRKSFKPENVKHHHQLSYKGLKVDGIVSHRHSCIACTRSMNGIYRQETRRSKFEDVLRTGYMGGKCIVDENDFKNDSHDESISRDNNSKEQQISQKDIVEPKGGRGCEQFPGADDIMSPSSKISESSSCYLPAIGSGYDNPEAYVQGVQDEIDYGSENDRCEEIELSQRNSKSLVCNFTAQCINDATYASAEAFSIGACTRLNGELQLELNPGVLSGEGGHSSHVEEVSGEEASLNEFSEEESTYSNSSRIGPPEFQDNLKRASQQSPDSVLEQFDIQNSSTFEHFDSIGLQLQLQALNFDSEETYSEGSSMVVSGDEDFDERFDDLSHDGRTVKRWLGDNKSRNYSYMVDVLDEAGFCGTKSFMDFKTWYSLDCLISPLVFQALEKKYGKQTSWQKSERQLLFDRINSGLIGIFNPVIKFHACATSIRSRICASLRRDEVEDELWMMLISEEKEERKDLSEKAFDKWFEIEEGINIVCSELETFLFDELVMELASLWD